MSSHIQAAPGPWEEGQQRPLFLAPMAGVTDLPFRLLARECGADVTITEFTNSTALTREATTSWRKVETDPRENPFIPQIFGSNIDDMATAASMLESNADIIDLNFGCPAPKVTNICAGAALMGEPEQLTTMVEHIIDSVSIPVTAKMRLGTGIGTNNATQLCQSLESVGASRLCIHGRTLRQRYSGVADWQAIADAVAAVDIPVIANGDIVDSHSAASCLKTTGAAGLMIGRAAIGRPTIFAEIKIGLGWMDDSCAPWVKANEKWYDYSPVQRTIASRSWAWNRYLELCLETTGMQSKWISRHAISFTKGLPHARRVRTIMHQAKTPDLMGQAIQQFLDELTSE